MVSGTVSTTQPILRGILREHTVSTEPFVSSSHSVFTTPLLELARLLGDDDGRHDRRSAWNYLRDVGKSSGGGFLCERLLCLCWRGIVFIRCIVRQLPPVLYAMRVARDRSDVDSS
jgi:hypothetical protein